MNNVVKMLPGHSTNVDRWKLTGFVVSLRVIVPFTCFKNVYSTLYVYGNLYCLCSVKVYIFGENSSESNTFRRLASNPLNWNCSNHFYYFIIIVTCLIEFEILGKLRKLFFVCREVSLQAQKFMEALLIPQVMHTSLPKCTLLTSTSKSALHFWFAFKIMSCIMFLHRLHF